jgi:hypothetical protein
MALRKLGEGERVTRNIKCPFLNWNSAFRNLFWPDFVGFFGVANRVSIDLRAERDAFIADENAA